VEQNIPGLDQVAGIQEDCADKGLEHVTEDLQIVQVEDVQVEEFVVFDLINHFLDGRPSALHGHVIQVFAGDLRLAINFSHRADFRRLNFLLDWAREAEFSRELWLHVDRRMELSGVLYSSHLGFPDFLLIVLHFSYLMGGPAVLDMTLNFVHVLFKLFLEGFSLFVVYDEFVNIVFNHN